MYGNRHAQKIYKRTCVTKFVPFQLFYSSNWNTTSQLEAEQSRSKLAICQGSRSACTRKGRVHRSHDLPTTSSHHAHLSLGDAVLTVEAHCTQVALERNGTHHMQHGPSWADPPPLTLTHHMQHGPSWADPPPLTLTHHMQHGPSWADPPPPLTLTHHMQHGPSWADPPPPYPNTSHAARSLMG